MDLLRAFSTNDFYKKVTIEIKDNNVILNSVTQDSSGVILSKTEINSDNLITCDGENCQQLLDLANLRIEVQNLIKNLIRKK